jgi:serine/threonine-protein kinase
MRKYCPTCFKKFPPTEEVCPHDNTSLVAVAEKDLVGEELDNRYTVVEKLGEGGMGIVYKAEQKMLKRLVALKVLRREIVQDENMVKRFMTEARAIASLSSRHTVTLHDFGVTPEGLLYYTMELLKGKSLATIIKEEAPMDPERAAELICQACESLHEAHSRGILHRDIKPDNLFVTEADGQEEVKVLDFGIAKLMGEQADGSVTSTGMIVGTPHYLSPEQALGDPVSPASDIYSLAAVYYEMLTGRTLFDPDTPTKMILAHVNRRVTPVHERNPEAQISPAVEGVLTKALAKNAADRYASARDLANALRQALGKPLGRGTTSVITSPPPVARSRPAANREGEAFSTSERRKGETVQEFTEAQTMCTPVPVDEASGLTNALPTPVQEHTAKVHTGALPPEAVPSAPAAGDEPTEEAGTSLSPRRPWKLWAGVAAAGIALGIGLAVWAPWTPAPTDEKKATDVAAASADPQRPAPVPGVGGGQAQGPAPTGGASPAASADPLRPAPVPTGGGGQAQGPALTGGASPAASADPQGPAPTGGASPAASADPQGPAPTGGASVAASAREEKRREEEKRKAAEAAEKLAASAKAQAEMDARAKKRDSLLAEAKAQKGKGQFKTAVTLLEEAEKLLPGNLEVAQLLKECREELEALEDTKFEGKKPPDANKPEDNGGLDDLKFK